MEDRIVFAVIVGIVLASVVGMIYATMANRQQADENRRQAQEAEKDEELLTLHEGSHLKYGGCSYVVEAVTLFPGDETVRDRYRLTLGGERATSHLLDIQTTGWGLNRITFIEPVDGETSPPDYKSGEPYEFKGERFAWTSTSTRIYESFGRVEIVVYKPRSHAADPQAGRRSLQFERSSGKLWTLSRCTEVSVRHITIG